MGEKERIKQPTSLDEQILILKERNLAINDEAKAKEILNRINYYRLSAYMLAYKRNDWFEGNVSFEDIYLLYVFDKKLRHLMLGVLETIEITFRTQIAYFIAQNYGSLGHENSENFVSEKRHKEMKVQLQTELKRSNEVFVQHHMEKYEGVFPVWVAVEVSSFGLLSKIFSNLRNEAKDEFCRDYYEKLPHKYIKSWLYAMSVFRNVCAHYGRTYNRSLTIKPMLHKKDAGKGIKNDTIFSIIFIIGKLIKDTSEWRYFITNLKALVEQYEIVDIKLLGFPDNWEQLLAGVKQT